MKPLLILMASAALGACSYGYDLPEFGTPAPPESFRTRPELPVPAGNPQTAAKIALGRMLFADPGLSGGGDMACTSCHQPDRAFTDGFPTARGSNGRPLLRNTPSILNAAYLPVQFWDGRSPSLEDQALRPAISGGEMGRHAAILVDAITADPRYPPMFAAAFPGEAISDVTVAKAIAAYERSLVSGPAPFDRWLDGNARAISPAAARGFALFAGKANCAACHSGWQMSDGKFHDIGLPDDDLGRGGITNTRALDHAFRTPPLRDVARTAPYMHDGSKPTLAVVVDHYAENMVKRRATPPKVALSPAERADIVAFLESLTSD